MKFTRFILCLLAAFALLCVCDAVAQEAVAPVTEAAADASATDAAGPVGFVNKLIDQLQTKAPWLAAILFIMAGLRAAMKPLMEAFYAYVKATPTPADDEFYERVQNSKALKIVSKVLDYVASIKIVHPKAGK